MAAKRRENVAAPLNMEARATAALNEANAAIEERVEFAHDGQTYVAWRDCAAAVHVENRGS